MKKSAKLVTLSVIGIIFCFIIGCQSEDFNETSPINQSCLTFGQLHNEVIGEILYNLSTSPTRSSMMTEAEFKQQCIDYAVESVLERDSSLSLQYVKSTITNISQRAVDDIRLSMSSYEKQVIDTVSRMISEEQTDVTIENYVYNSNLNLQQKQGVINFYDTYQSSSEYWAEHGKEWIAYIEENVDLSSGKRSSWYKRISWGQVAFSDAYYGWYGTVSTGGNIYVGIGAAAAGSIFSILNQM